MNLNELAKVIKDDPFAVDQWQEMLEILVAIHDYANKKSVTIIIRGINSLPIDKIKNSGAGTLLGAVLSKLSASFNNPKLFKEAGRIYLQEFHMADVAREHLEHAKFLRCQDQDLASWIQAATTVAGIRGATDASVKYLPSGLSNILRRTERLCLIQDQNSDSLASPSASQKMAISDDPTKRLEQAVLAISLGDWNGAHKLLNGLSKKDVDGNSLWNTWTKLGEGCFLAGRYFYADLAYRAAADLFPDRFVSQLNRGIGLYLIRRCSEAIEALLRADSLEADNPVVWFYMGRVKMLMEKYEEAEVAFRKSVTKKDNVAQSWDGLAGALGCLNRVDEAFAACQKAVQLRPNFPEAHFKMGLILFSQRKFDTALTSLSVSAAHPVLSFYANAYISMCFSETRLLTGAERAIRLAAQAMGSVPELLGKSWWALGRSRLDLMEFRMAITALNEACRLSPSESQNWLDLGFAYQFTKDARQAIDCFTRAVELDRAA